MPTDAQPDHGAHPEGRARGEQGEAPRWARCAHQRRVEPAELQLCTTLVRLYRIRNKGWSGLHVRPSASAVAFGPALCYGAKNLLDGALYYVVYVVYLVKGLNDMGLLNSKYYVVESQKNKYEKRGGWLGPRASGQIWTVRYSALGSV